MANPKIVYFLVLCIFAFSKGDVVDIPNLGRIEGTATLTKWSLQKVYEFRAIPYAKSPSLTGRFRPAEKIGPWTGTKDATQYGQACPQPGYTAPAATLYGQFLSHDEATLARRTTGDLEDCLTLDVYTKRLNNGPSDQKPVFVAIHGGSFLYGMSSSLKPGFLLDENDIVLVVPQYRLGPFGFLNFNTNEAPGNMGLSDLVLALEWVRDNIRSFGGDPSRVTVGGNSAGGASASHLMLSSKARGLFHQIIPQSGPATSFWALDKVSSDVPSTSLANEAGCQGTASQLITCLRSKTVPEVMTAYVKYAIKEYFIGELGMKNSMPVIDRDIIAKDPLISLEGGEFEAIPALVTVVKHEGIFALDLMYQSFLTPNNLVSNSTYLREDLIPIYLRLLGVNDDFKVLNDALLAKYINPGDIGNFTKMTPGLIDLTGVLAHKAPSYTQAHSHAAKANTYILSFDYFGEHTTHDDTNMSVPIPGGITHSDELIYLYPREGRNLNEEDTKIAKLMTKIFGNFITSGNPSSTPLEGVPEWPRLTGLQRHVMSIRNGQHKLISDYRETYTAARVEGLVYKNSAPITQTFSLSALLFATAAAIFH